MILEALFAGLEVIIILFCCCYKKENPRLYFRWEVFNSPARTPEKNLSYSGGGEETGSEKNLNNII